MNMKRYWKLISIVALIVLTIGTFYIQQSMANSSYPQFVIETKSGDESLIKPLEIDASYRNQGTWANLIISSKGSEYREDLSLLNEVFQSYQEPEIKRLQDEYRHFMRGKPGIASRFYEDDSHLIHVDVTQKVGFNSYEPRDFKFEIVALDKSSKDKTTFKLQVPDEHLYHFVDVVDIQLVDDKLLIVTRNGTRVTENIEYQDFTTNMHLYTFSITEETILKEETIEIDFSEINKEEMQMADMYTIINEDQLGPNQFILFALEMTEERMTEDGMYIYEPVGLQLVSYNVEANESIKLDLPEEYKEGYRPERMKDNYVYLSKNSDNQLDIIRFNVETNEVETKQTFDLPTVSMEATAEFGGIQGGYSTIKNDKVYYISTLKSDKIDATVFVGDIETGDILYEGTIEHDPNTITPSKYQLELYYFRMK